MLSLIAKVQLSTLPTAPPQQCTDALLKLTTTGQVHQQPEKKPTAVHPIFRGSR